MARETPRSRASKPAANSKTTTKKATSAKPRAKAPVKKPAGKPPSPRVVDRLLAQQGAWSEEQIELAVGWLPALDASRLNDVASGLAHALADKSALASRHLDAIIACLDHASQAGPTATLVERLPVELSLEQRARILADGGDAWFARGRIAAGGGEDMVSHVRDVMAAAPEADYAHQDYARLACGYAALLLGPAAGPLTAALEALRQPPDFDARSKFSFDGTVTPSLVAALALVSIDPTRAEADFEYLRIAIRCQHLMLGGRGPGGRVRHDLCALFSRLPESSREKLAAELAELVSPTLDVHAELLGALGRPGVARTLAMLDSMSSFNDQNYGIHIGLLNRGLAHAELTADERTRIARIAKTLALSANKHPTYLAFACMYGGPEACAPELARAEVLDALVSYLPYENAALWPGLFDALHAGGVDVEQLRSIARKLVAEHRVPWLAPFASGVAATPTPSPR